MPTTVKLYIAGLPAPLTPPLTDSDAEDLAAKFAAFLARSEPGASAQCEYPLDKRRGTRVVINLSQIAYLEISGLDG